MRACVGGAIWEQGALINTTTMDGRTDGWSCATDDILMNGNLVTAAGRQRAPVHAQCVRAWSKVILHRQTGRTSPPRTPQRLQTLQPIDYQLKNQCFHVSQLR